MQKTYKGLSAAKIAKTMVADGLVPNTYWTTIKGREYRVMAHRNSVQMFDGSIASKLCLDTMEGDGATLRWDGRPETVKSATVEL